MTVNETAIDKGAANSEFGDLEVVCDGFEI